MYHYNRISLSYNTMQLLGAVISILQRPKIEAQLVAAIKKHFAFQSLHLYSSGREALLSIFNQLDISKREVIVPAYGCPIVAEVVKTGDKTPVFVDIQADTLGLSPKKLSEAINFRTGAVIYVHELGRLAPERVMLKIRDIWGGYLVEDAAVAYGGMYKDSSRLGSVSDAVVFSGSLGKPIGASAWGAAGFNGAAETHHAIEKSASSMVSLVKCLAMLILQYPVFYDLFKSVLDKAVREDSSDVFNKGLSPSAFDNYLVLSQFLGLQRERENRWKSVSKFKSILLEAGCTMLNFPEQVPLLHRLAFWTHSVAHRIWLIERAKGAGVEVSMPFQTKLYAEDDSLFPVAASARERICCIAIKRNVKPYIFERLREATRNSPWKGQS